MSASGELRSLDRVRERVDLTYRLLSPPVLRAMNASMREMWRLGLGPMLNCCPRLFGRYMVVTTTGRRTGRLRRTSVNYVELSGALYCLSGWGRTSAWYLNLLARPEVELWTTAGWLRALGEPVTDDSEARRGVRALLEQTGMLAPLLVGVSSDQVDDAMLAALAEWWPVVRFRATEAVPERIADRAWIWPVAALLFAGWRSARRRRASPDAASIETRRRGATGCTMIDRCPTKPTSARITTRERSSSG